MPNKIQRAARERQKKSGESYSTALMHVRATMAAEPERPQGVLLGPWVTDDMPGVSSGTVTRLLVGSEDVTSKPLVVAFAVNAWKVFLAPGTAQALVQGSFAAPTGQIARLYADDFLYSRGFSGTGVGPLPPGYPPLRTREDTHVASSYEPSVLLQAAKCECGYVGEDIVDRHAFCPECNGCTVLMAHRLLPLAKADGDSLDSRGAVEVPLSFGVRAFSRRRGRAETLTFSRTDDGWFIENPGHRHPTRPDGSRWKDRRAGGHRGLDFFLVNEDYVHTSWAALAEVLGSLWSSSTSPADARSKVQALFA